MPEGKGLNNVAAVATADADGTYGAPEAALINELKDRFNELLVELKARGFMDRA